jgi:transposase InsO family protein
MIARRRRAQGPVRGRADLQAAADRPVHLGGPPRLMRPLPARADLVERDFWAVRPNQLWVAGLAYAASWSGLSMWRLSSSVPRGLAGRPVAADRPGLDALEMAIWRRQAQLEGLVHDSDRAAKSLAIRYTERFAEADAVTPVGSRSDSYDNALAKTIIGLYQTELVHRRGPVEGPPPDRVRHLGVGRLVQPPPAPGTDRAPPAGRVKSGVTWATLGWLADRPNAWTSHANDHRPSTPKSASSMQLVLRR